MLKNLGVCVVVEDWDSDKIYLQHNIERGWELVGGKVEYGETPEEAAKREIKEEIAIEAWPRLMGAANRDEWCVLCYVAIAREGQIPTVNEVAKVDDIRLFTLPEVWELADRGEIFSLALDTIVNFYLPLVRKESLALTGEIR